MRKAGEKQQESGQVQKEGPTSSAKRGREGRKARAEAGLRVPGSAGPGSSSWGAGGRLMGAATTWQWVEMGTEGRGK